MGKIETRGREEKREQERARKKSSKKNNNPLRDYDYDEKESF